MLKRDFNKNLTQHNLSWRKGLYIKVKQNNKKYRLHDVYVDLFPYESKLHSNGFVNYQRFEKIYNSCKNFSCGNL